MASFDVRPGSPARIAAFALALVALVLPVIGGVHVVADVPLLDDWGLLQGLQRHLAGQTSLLEYLLLRHNEHFVVPSRLAFLIAYHVAGLDLRTVRWLSILTCFGAAWLVTATVRRDLARVGVGGAQRAWLLVPCVCLPTSLAGWETVNLAMTFTNAFSLLVTLGGVLAFDRWLCTGSLPRFAALCALTLAATLSLASGLLSWILFASVTTWRFRFSSRRVETAVLWTFGAVLLWMQRGAPTSAPGASSVDPVRVVLGVAQLAGVPVGWPGPVGDVVAVVVGAASIVATFVMAWSVVRGRGDAVTSAKYALWSATGLLVAFVVSLARHRSVDGPNFAASRHVPMVLPLMLGCHAQAVVASVGSRTGRRFAMAGTLVLVGLTAVADVVEWRTWPARAAAFRAMRKSLVEDDLATLPAEVWRTRFFLDPRFAPQVAGVVAFLRAERLSFFR